MPTVRSSLVRTWIFVKKGLIEANITIRKPHYVLGPHPGNLETSSLTRRMFLPRSQATQGSSLHCLGFGVVVFLAKKLTTSAPNLKLNIENLNDPNCCTTPATLPKALKP